jgi:hypothetical protein
MTFFIFGGCTCCVALLGLYYSGRQSQQSSYVLVPLTHYMFRSIRATFRRVLSTYQLHLQDLMSVEQEIRVLLNAKPPTAGWFPSRLIFDPEDGGDAFL